MNIKSKSVGYVFAKLQTGPLHTVFGFELEAALGLDQSHLPNYWGLGAPFPRRPGWGLNWEQVGGLT